MGMEVEDCPGEIHLCFMQFFGQFSTFVFSRTMVHESESIYYDKGVAYKRELAEISPAGVLRTETSTNPPGRGFHPRSTRPLARSHLLLLVMAKPDSLQ